VQSGQLSPEIFATLGVIEAIGGLCL